MIWGARCSSRIRQTVLYHPPSVVGGCREGVCPVLAEPPAIPAEADPRRPGAGRLGQIVAYGRDVYDLQARLGCVRDARKEPKTAASDVAATLFFTGLLRIRSLNALEPRLSEKPFLRLIGKLPELGRLCSADTLSRALRVMELESVRGLAVGIVQQAERNKVFREGWHWALRYVALDGWEPIQSWNRHCRGCLVRRVKAKDRSGKVGEIDQYYHRFVVAMLIDERFDLLLDIESVLPHDLRPPHEAGRNEDEGELTAAKRLLARVKRTYGWLDVVVADGLYANGPFLSLVATLGMGAVVIARKETDEPLREARRIWKDQPPHDVTTNEAGERVELWDCPGLETLTTYEGSIRVVLGRIRKSGDPQSPARDWCMAVTGCAVRLPAHKVLSVARGRWHIENTGFHQWSTHWHFTHVFTHDHRALQALYWLFFAAYNLLTLFLYRQLRCYGRDRGRDVTRTIRRLVEEMRDDLARLAPHAWDTS